MKKKLLSLLLVFAMVFSLGSTAFAESNDAAAAANALYALGLFNGTGTDDSGNPIFDLDRAPTRHEAVTMLVRLLGKDAEAKAGTYTTPFTDVAGWAQPYVGYAYTNGLTNGISDTEFGGNNTVSATQYLTFVLRALGYESGVDFQWNKAWELSDKLGITNGQYDATSEFLRGDVAVVSYKALSAPKKTPSTQAAPVETVLEILEVVADTNYKISDAYAEASKAASYLADVNKLIETVAASQAMFKTAIETLNKAFTACGDYEETRELKRTLSDILLKLSPAATYVLDGSFETATNYLLAIVEIDTTAELDKMKAEIDKLADAYQSTPEEEPVPEEEPAPEVETLNIQGYWIGTNYVSATEKMVEAYYFDGNKYSCAYACLDAATNYILFRVYEEGTFTFKNNVLTLNRTAEYVYIKGYSKTQVDRTKETLQYTITGAGNYMKMESWSYERSSYAESVYDEVKSFIMARL